MVYKAMQESNKNNTKMSSFINTLKQELDAIETTMVAFLEKSKIKRFQNDPDSQVVFIGPEYYWDELTEEQKRIQIALKDLYLSWFEYFNLLFSHAPERIKKEIKEANNFVMRWIERNESDWNIPATIQKATSKFKEKLNVFYNNLKLKDTSIPNELILVPDTNSLIQEPDLTEYSKIVNTTQFTIILLTTIFSELDELKIKHRDSDFRAKVDSVIRRIKGLRQQGDWFKGVTINKSITVKAIAQEPNFNSTLKWLDSSNKDDRIIASILQIQIAYPSATVILVTSDINLQNKATMAKLLIAEPPIKKHKIVPQKKKDNTLNAAFINTRKTKWQNLTWAWVMSSITPFNISDDVIDPANNKNLINAVNGIALPGIISNNPVVNRYHTKSDQDGLINEDWRNIHEGKGHTIKIFRNGHAEFGICLGKSTKKITDYYRELHPNTPDIITIFRYSDIAECIINQLKGLAAIWNNALPFNEMFLTTIITKTNRALLYSKEGDIKRNDVFGHEIDSELLEYNTSIHKKEDINLVAETTIKRFVNYFGLHLNNVFDRKGELIRPEPLIQ